MRKLDTADLFDEAAKLIEPEGMWQQGAYGVGDGPFCAVGAIRRVCGVDGVHWDRMDSRVSDHLQNKFFTFLHDHGHLTPVGRNFANIVQWNDHHSRTQAEVVEVLREAAADLR